MKKFKNIKWIIYFLLGATVFLQNCTQQSQNTTQQTIEQKEIYTCPMHPDIIRDKPGNCPICNMKLVKKITDLKAQNKVELSSLLKPANQFVVSAIAVTTIKPDISQNEMEAIGVTDYDTRMIGNIAAKVSGRIQNLYVRYTFQEVMKGQKVMDIYSPELLTAEQNLLFLVKNDAPNTSLINTAKQKLVLLGVSSNQLQQIIKTGKPSYAVSVYSNYTGHIHDMQNDVTPTGKTDNLITKELKIKEGMSVEKGQTIFSVYNPHKVAALIDVYPEQQSFIKTGNVVRIIPESYPDKYFSARIDFIEPFLREGSKTLKARAYFDNSSLNIPVRSPVRAIIFGKNHIANWLPKESVISLGRNKLVFLKTKDGFQTHNVQTGTEYKNQIEIVNGLTPTDSVAVNAQYLMDAESIIKAK